MLRWLIRKRLAAVERDLGVPVDYVRHILDVSLGAFLRCGMVMPLEKYRRSLPAGPYHVARLVAVRHEDCGPCVQIVVNLAKKDGVAPQVLQAALAAAPDALPEDLADAYCFAEAVVTRSGDEDRLRERIRQRYGEAGLVEMALAIAVCRIFPTAKRGLGYATSCSKVTVHV
jgi:alkylhydroperoxidase family enzyme